MSFSGHTASIEKGSQAGATLRLETVVIVNNQKWYINIENIYSIKKSLHQYKNAT